MGVAVTPPQDLGLGAAAACRAPLVQRGWPEERQRCGAVLHAAGLCGVILSRAGQQRAPPPGGLGTPQTEIWMGTERPGEPDHEQPPRPPRPAAGPAGAG